MNLFNTTHYCCAEVPSLAASLSVLTIHNRNADKNRKWMFTESSWAFLLQWQAAYDSVFHQLDQRQHHLRYSSWHWSRHPNAHNTITITSNFSSHSSYVTLMPHFYKQFISAEINEHNLFSMHKWRLALQKWITITCVKGKASVFI